jgi:putative transposase
MPREYRVWYPGATLFQGRFGSKVNESIKYFLTVSRYIHRNPLEAHLADYRWSSYSSYIHNKKNPHIDPTRTFSYFKEPVHEQYRLYVECENKEDLL